MEIVPRHQLRAASLRHHEVISLCNTDMNRVLSIRITCIPFREEGMAGQDPVHTLVHQGMRSEEHTSELQSLAYLVCRLLLEKKKLDDARADRCCKQLSQR